MEFDWNEFNGLVSLGKVREIIEYMQQFPDYCADALAEYIDIYEKKQFPAIGEDEGLDEILLCYQKYYREVFYLELPEAECAERLRLGLLEMFPEVTADMDIDAIEEGPFLDLVTRKGWFMKPGRIAGYRSPFIWKKSEPRTYQVELPEGIQECTFVFAEDFIFLGHWWYLSMGRYMAGAWVGDDGIVYCDWKSYDLESEDFNISMLKHEAQHVMDLNRWSNISSEMLEYRAYLLDLIYYKAENRLPHFHNKGSLDDPSDEYARAAYYVCYDFYQRFPVEDFASIPIPEIQAYARELLRISTEKCLEAFNGESA